MAIADLEKQCDLLLSEIEESCRKASVIRREIEKYQKAAETHSVEAKEDELQPEENIISEDLDTNEEFESEVEYYLSDYRDLDEDFTLEDLIDILPNKKNYHYNIILFRLHAEAVKEIKELEEVIAELDRDSSDELMEYQSLLALEKKKRNALIEVSQKQGDALLEEEEKNELILMPTETGNIRVLDEAEHIPREYYQAFYDLIQTIVDGTFKGVKRFKNNRYLNGISEVRGFKTRVLFTRVGTRKYALLSAFIKKCNNDAFYQETLKGKVADYRKVEDYLKSNVDDPEFLSLNEENVQQLFSMLLPDEDRKESILCK